MNPASSKILHMERGGGACMERFTYSPCRIFDEPVFIEPHHTKKPLVWSLHVLKRHRWPTLPARRFLHIEFIFFPLFVYVHIFILLHVCSYTFIFCIFTFYICIFIFTKCMFIYIYMYISFLHFHVYIRIVCIIVFVTGMRGLPSSPKRALIVFLRIVEDHLYF